MTKGNLTEQSGEIERFGLKEYFAAVEIVGRTPATPTARPFPSTAWPPI